MESNNPFQAFDAAGNEETVDHLELLRRTQPWLFLMAILMLLGGALTGVVTVTMFLGMGVGATLPDSPFGAGGTVMVLGLGLLYGLMTFVYLILGYFLLRQATSIGALRSGGGLSALGHVLRYQLFFWRTLGIATLSMLVLYCGGLFTMFAVFNSISGDL
ncbi:MAG TPA: hypothetical protein ENK18_08105 [Deltaproteobacteria bacterium]|nr:hypothetical protein [Deltaproteobacteria bacterium]